MSRKLLHSETRASEGALLLNAIKALGSNRKAVAESIKISPTLMYEMCSGAKSIQDYHLVLLEKTHSINPEYIKGESKEIFIKRDNDRDYLVRQINDTLSKIDVSRLNEAFSKDTPSNDVELNAVVQLLKEEFHHQRDAYERLVVFKDKTIKNQESRIAKLEKQLEEARSKYESMLESMALKKRESSSKSTGHTIPST